MSHVKVLWNYEACVIKFIGLPFLLLFSCVQDNILVRHLHPAQCDNPLPQATTPLTSYTAIIISLTIFLTLYFPEGQQQKHIHF